jgi:hypothetical protein
MDNLGAWNGQSFFVLGYEVDWLDYYPLGCQICCRIWP